MAYLAVGATWVAGIVCSTILVINCHVWFALLVLILSALAGYQKKDSDDATPDHPA